MPLFVLKSSNRKIGPIACTYQSIAGTCPDSSDLKKNGCYAQMGPVGIHVAKLDKAWRERSDNKDGYAMARAEARLIDDAIKNKDIRGVPLRLHVSGDVKTKKGAKALAAAAKRWKDNGGGHVYTYTHSWKTIPRDHFGTISVLASVENKEDAVRAIKKGYAPAILVPEFPRGAKTFGMDGLKIIPCPAQTHENVSCKSCKLCMNADRLHKDGYAIGFTPHGVGKKKALTVIK